MKTTEAQVEQAFEMQLRNLSAKIDRLFVYLFAGQWILAILFAVFVSPLAWAGDENGVHIHVFGALLLGGLTAVLPMYLGWTQPGAPKNKYVIAISQILFSTLLIHLSGGRIETHFHVFGSIAFLAMYRDAKVIVLATVITAADHFLRGIFWPESVYGVLTATPWRALEHSAWVLFEDSFLFVAIAGTRKELRGLSQNQLALAAALSDVENKVEERTRELRDSQKIVFEQQKTLVSNAKMSALGEMAAGVAHEINNPLSVIKNVSAQLSEVVAEDPLDRPLITKMAQSITDTTDRIARIVSGLRTFSRDSSADPFVSVNLKRLVEETSYLCGERFQNHQTTLRIENLPADLHFSGRAAQISQVLLNLLNNSFDAVANLPSKWIEVSASRRGEFVEVRITDSGHGIPEDVRKKIFQPFFTTKPVGKGTGMGLSVSLGIVEAHSGQLRVDAASPNTTFVLSLPVSSAGPLAS